MKIQKLNVKRIAWKEGDTNGRAWRRAGILTKEYGDKWLSCFESKFNSEWLRSIRQNVIVTAVVEERGEYLNFHKPREIDYLNERVGKLEDEVYGSKYEEKNK